MTPRVLRLALAGTVSALAAGCTLQSFTYTVDRYGSVAGVSVRLGCRDTYEVFDRPEAATFIVITNGLNEVLVGCLDGGPPLAERQRQVAKIFLEEKSSRPQCRLLGDAELTPLHREFSYRCPASAFVPPPASVLPPTTVPGPVAIPVPGRRRG